MLTIATVNIIDMNSQDTEYIINKLDKIHEITIETRIEQAGMKKDVSRNTEDLSEHIEGVLQNRVRIEVLEKDTFQPKRFAKALIIIGKVIVALTLIGGAGMAVLNYIQ